MGAHCFFSLSFVTSFSPKSAHFSLSLCVIFLDEDDGSGHFGLIYFFETYAIILVNRLRRKGTCDEKRGKGLKKKHEGLDGGLN